MKTIPIQEGMREDVREIRNGLPEPTKYNNDRIIGLKLEPICGMLWNGEFKEPSMSDINVNWNNRYFFHKELVRVNGQYGDPIQVWVWVCDLDGCMYF